MTANYSAEIYEALGRHDVAANLRWRKTPVSHAELEEQVQDLSEQLGNAEERLLHLESVLCKRCVKEWEAA
jgi:hypothetical protein